ncbi:MAG: hypothetical protein H7336_11175 [Bacteriovorax sp.]|nr:hypothetical protein [Bacteriovorax sp.]
MTKMVFAATVEKEGLKISCDSKGYQYYVCSDESKKIAVKSTDNGWVAFAKDDSGIVSLKPISTLTSTGKYLTLNEVQDLFKKAEVTFEPMG